MQLPTPPKAARIAVALLALFAVSTALAEPLDTRLLPLLPPETAQISGFDIVGLQLTGSGHGEVLSWERMR